MRILFLGDVVGRAGRDTVGAALPKLRADVRADVVIVNAENASHGFGLAPDMARALFAAGADVITLGNHAWDRKELIPYIAETPAVIRPLNFPPGTPGAGVHTVTLRMAGAWPCWPRRWAGCTWTRSTARSASRHQELSLVQIARRLASPRSWWISTPRPPARNGPTPISFDGQVSLVVGTHTHSPSADHQILRGRHRLPVRRRHVRRLRQRHRHDQGGARPAGSGARCPATSWPRRTGR